MIAIGFATIALSIYQIAPTVAVHRDIEFARVGEHSLKLDLYLSEKGNNRPLIVWVHGGAWRAGSRKSMPLQKIVENGWCAASVDYRLSPVARFPAQIHDIKAAIRFLRANQKRYGYNAKRIVIAGASAGGHLAALVGVTNGVKELEGNVGNHLDQSSDVHAIVSYYGASNLQTILSQSTPHGLKVRVPALELLLGGQPDVKPMLARLASPVAHVDEIDPPLLLIHGDQDPQMPINQAHELFGAYKKVEGPADFIVIYGAAHGGAVFYRDVVNQRVIRFLTEHALKASCKR